jgi:DNA-binding CsgD family transcriptional regulator
MLTIDDAHWIDDASLRCLLYLSRRVDEVPIAIVLALRPEPSGPGAEMIARVAAEPAAVVLRLHPLSAAAARELVCNLVSADADDRLCEACFKSTGGNPFLLRELASALAETGMPSSQREISQIERLVPRAVARHVLVRLGRQSPAATAFARAVAMLGAGAQMLHASELAGLDEDQAAEALDALVASDILAKDPPLAFVHPLLREVVYSEMAPGKRALEHRRAARLLADRGAEPERVASQLLASGPAGADWAVQFLRTAARDAQARGSPQSAAMYLGGALAEPPTPPERAAVLLELGLAEAAAALPAASEHLAAAHALARDPIERARIASELAVALEHRNRPAEAVAVLEDAIDHLADRNSDLSLSLVAQSVVAANTFLGSRRALSERITCAIAQLSATCVSAGPLLAALSYEAAHRGGTAEQTVALAERGLASGSHGASLWDGVVMVVAAEALSRCDRLSRAVAVLDGLLTAARAHGATHVESAALTARAMALNRTGRLLDAEADARLALAIAEDEPWDFLRPYKLAGLTDALIAQGQLDAAAQLLPHAEVTRHEADQTIFQVFLHDTYARLLALQGRCQEALREIAIVEQADCDWDIRNPGWTTWRLTAALVYHRLGQPERAAALAQDELRMARTFGAPRAIGIALRTAALVAREVQIPQLVEAAEVLEHSEARFEFARTLVELGAALRRTGHPGEARGPLETGLELARECGGPALADQAYQELLATGARARGPLNARLTALTPSELRVATMAADGLSNREIAQALYVSLKTVEMHMSHVYDKLGDRSRVRLTTALQRKQSIAREYTVRGL